MNAEAALLEQLAELRKNYARLMATCGTNHLSQKTKEAYADRAEEISTQLQQAKA